MQEKHQFDLVTVLSSMVTKNKAKSKWLNGWKKKHKDEITPLNDLSIYYDCELIKKSTIGKYN